MLIRDSGPIRHYEFESLQQPGLTHAVFARHGGVSAGAFASLNMSISVGDSAENVRANRERAFRAVGRDPDSIADLWQIHSADVVVADQPRGERDPASRGDALITDRPEVTLFLRFADCVPILLFDPRRRAIGVVHAGWRGTLQKVAGQAARALVERYGSRPADILAGIGPSIGVERYPVGPEVVEATRRAFADRAEALLRPVNGGHHLDLWRANAAALREAGVVQIEIGGVCTASNPRDFFSHRGEGGQTGRFGALIALE